MSHGLPTLAHEFVVPGGATIERELSLPAPLPYTKVRLWVHVYEEGGIPWPGWGQGYRPPGETWAYEISDGKGVEWLPAQARVLAAPNTALTHV